MSSNPVKRGRWLSFSVELSLGYAMLFTLSGATPCTWRVTADNGTSLSLEDRM